MIREKSAGAVVFHENKRREFLLLHYIPGHWDFPKGKIEHKETEEEAAEREIKEETSLKEIKFLPKFKEKIDYWFKRKGDLIHKEVIYFLVRTEKTEVKISDEHTGFKWLEYKEALNILNFKNSKRVMENAERYLETMRL